MRYFIVSLILLFSFNLDAQHDFSASLEIYEKAKSSLYLLKNDLVKIPLQGSAVLKTKHFYNTDLSELPALMNIYYPVESHSLNRHIRNIQTSKGGFTILSLDLSTIKNYTETIHHFQAILEKENTVTILFDSANEIKNASYLDFSKCTHLLYVKGNTKLQQSLAVQTLFGGIDLNNKLSEDLNTAFKKGQGLTLKGGLRLGYAPPELVGIKGDILNDQINPIIKKAIDAGAFPGCQILIAKDQKIVFHKPGAITLMIKNKQ